MEGYLPANIPARSHKVSQEQGFTLIELSIVLVIIGLIVGGVLVGQDLIKAAEVRATVGQIEKYNSAVNTFRSKFNGIPGDLSSTNAAAFGFATRTGDAGKGDNNGLIDTTVTGQVWGQEPALFWNDLSVANLVDGSYTGAANVDSAAPLAITTTLLPTTLPPARIGRGNSLTVGSTGGLNYYIIGGITSAAVTSGQYTMTTNLTPTEAYNMDTKLDDGMPNTGVVQVRGVAGATATLFTDWGSHTTATTSGKCMMTGAAASDSTNTYNRVLASGGSVPACIMRFRFN